MADMLYPKDHLSFLYIHDEAGEVVFTSRTASNYCRIPRGGAFNFQDLTAPEQQDVIKVNKERTRSCAPAIHTYRLWFVGGDEQQTAWEGIVHEKFIVERGRSGVQGVVTMANATPALAMEYLARVLLKKGRMNTDALLPINSNLKEIEQVTTEVVEVLQNHSLHFPKHDEWFTSGGKERFWANVKYHVERSIPLEFILPAFPVKSCNPDKVIGKCPDKGEELAIHSMKKVADLIKQVYPPGAHYNIVSDGHVFSDLVGVDDGTVDAYGRMFRDMAADLYPGLITFYRLDNFIMPDSSDIDEITKLLIEETHLDHPVMTQLTGNAETARRIMMSLFGTEDSCLRKDIKNDKETASLYRGFTRFMMEDLAQHESCKALPSKSARKRLCKRVGFLMIQRNRAYSTLVEWLFPLQLRISIHPHPNRGPKYGVNLIHSSFVTTQRDSSEQLFHIPTPWHNAVLEKADGTYLLAQSKTILCGDGVVLVHYPDGRPSHFKEVLQSRQTHLSVLGDVGSCCWRITRENGHLLEVKFIFDEKDLSVYAQNGLLEEAKRMYDKMPERDLVAMLSALYA